MILFCSGVNSSCNHIAAALFRLEAAFHFGLCNPACTTKPCEWLPNRREVQPCKVIDMNLNRDDFKKRRRTARKLITTPKRNFNPIENSCISVSFNSIVEALGEKVKNTVLSTALKLTHQPEIDFYREVLQVHEHVNEGKPHL